MVKELTNDFALNNYYVSADIEGYVVKGLGNNVRRYVASHNKLAVTIGVCHFQ